MKTIDEIYALVEESSHETAFNKEEVFGLYEILSKLPDNSIAVEIGVEYGRSTTVFAEFKKAGKLAVFAAIDNWCQEDGALAKAHVNKQIKKHDWSFDIYSMDSVAAAKRLQWEIDLIHIDGDHTYEGVKSDCEAWLAKVKKGGFACFDDYGHPGLNGVKQAVDEYCLKHQNFKKIGLYGNKLQVFQKVRN